MTGWKVTWTKSAHNYYQRMPKNYRKKVKEVVTELKIDPFSLKNVSRLHGELEGLYRYRLGKFRMIFRALEDAKEVRILAIASRGNAYK